MPKRSDNRGRKVHRSEQALANAHPILRPPIENRHGLLEYTDKRSPKYIPANDGNRRSSVL